VVLLFVQPLWIFDGIDAVSYQKEIWHICEVYNEELLNTCKTLDLRELEEVADVVDLPFSLPTSRVSGLGCMSGRLSWKYTLIVEC